MRDHKGHCSTHATKWSRRKIKSVYTTSFGSMLANGLGGARNFLAAATKWRPLSHNERGSYDTHVTGRCVYCSDYKRNY